MSDEKQTMDNENVIIWKGVENDTNLKKKKVHWKKKILIVLHNKWKIRYQVQLERSLI